MIILPGTLQTASGCPDCVCARPRLPLGGAGLRPGVRSWESGGLRVAQGLEVGKRPGHRMAPRVPLSPSSSDGRLETLPPRSCVSSDTGAQPCPPKAVVPVTCLKHKSETLNCASAHRQSCFSVEWALLSGRGKDRALMARRPPGGQVRAPARSGEGPQEACMSLSTFTPAQPTPRPGGLQEWTRVSKETDAREVTVFSARVLTSKPADWLPFLITRSVVSRDVLLVAHGDVLLIPPLPNQ